MYIRSEYGPIVKKYVTDSEILWDKISYERVKELIKSKDFIVTECTKDSCAYGEFTFIRLYNKHANMELVMYGLGYHHYRESYLYDQLHFSGANFNTVEDSVSLNKETVLANLDKEYKECEKLDDEISKSNSRSKASYYFNALSEVCDEDGVVSMLEDMRIL